MEKDWAGPQLKRIYEILHTNQSPRVKPLDSPLFVHEEEDDHSQFPSLKKDEPDTVGIPLPPKVQPMALPFERTYRADDAPLNADDELHLPRWMAKER